MKSKITSIIFFFLLSHNLMAQLEKSIAQLPSMKDDFKRIKTRLTPEKKIEMLQALVKGDKVQFIRANSLEEDIEEERYYNLDTSGLYFVDLDLDGDLDLLYSGTSGLMGRIDTKVYLNVNGQLILNEVLSGNIISITKNKKTYTFHTLTNPCCDSYTALINQYSFSNDTVIVRDYSLYVIGRLRLTKLPNFNTKKTRYISNTSLYASPQDFKSTSPYFGKRTGAIRDSLRQGHFVQLVYIKNRTPVDVISKQTYQGQLWHLIITEPISIVRNSLYEQVNEDKVRFIAWVKTLD